MKQMKRKHTHAANNAPWLRVMSDMELATSKRRIDNLERRKTKQRKGP